MPIGGHGLPRYRLPICTTPPVYENAAAGHAESGASRVEYAQNHERQGNSPAAGVNRNTPHLITLNMQATTTWHCLSSTSRINWVEAVDDDLWRMGRLVGRGDKG